MNSSKLLKASYHPGRGGELTHWDITVDIDGNLIQRIFHRVVGTSDFSCESIPCQLTVSDLENLKVLLQQLKFEIEESELGYCEYALDDEMVNIQSNLFEIDLCGAPRVPEKNDSLSNSLVEIWNAIDRHAPSPLSCEEE
jgi:hypothetical protein